MKRKSHTYDGYAGKVREHLLDAYAETRVSLKRTAQTQKKYYDLKVKPTVFEKGSWVYYFHPRYYQGKQDKWIRKYLGPYLVVDTPSQVNVTLQARPKGKKFSVHIDKVKPFYDKTPKSWLRTEDEDTRQTEVKRRIIEDGSTVQIRMTVRTNSRPKKS